MAWFIGQSLIFTFVAFLLGLSVGWLWWGRRRPAAAAAVVEEPTAGLAQSPQVIALDGQTAVVADPAAEESGDQPTGVIAEPARGSVIAAEEPTAVIAALPVQRAPEPEREAEPEPEVKPEADAAPDVEPEPAAEPEPVPGAEPEPVAAAEPAAEPEQVIDDDLERIEGIGPKMSAALRAAGIRTYGKLAGSDEATLRAAIEKAGLTFAPSIVTWARQARLLADGDEEGFADLTRRLVAGRDIGRM